MHTSTSPESRHTNASSRSSRLRSLLLLNMLLLVVLGGVTFGARVQAQNRPRGEYTMASGGLSGTDADAIFIVDTISQEMFAVYYDNSTRMLQGLGYRNLAADAAAHTRAQAARSSAK